MRSCLILLAILARSISLASGQESREAPAKQDLPNVVLLGDSIRLSYAAEVAKLLDGKALIISPKPNGGDSSNLLKNLQQWAIDEQPQVVHFNCGIHDTKKFFQTGKFQVSPEQYEANLRAIVHLIRQETDAVVLFATTTPILDAPAAAARKGRDYELLNASVEEYNKIARKVMQELKVPVNDLHATLSRPEEPLTTEALIVSDGVHLQAKGRSLVGKQVADFIAEQLSQKSN